MNNIDRIKDCYGCGLCATICGKKAISINLNKEGFYEPLVDIGKCSGCGLCQDVCSYMAENPISEYTFIPKGYAAWSKDEAVRRKCSSGGVGFELGRYLIERGYKVCGVRYNPEQNRAEHYIATTVEELIQTAGSKYIQSYTVDGFKAINLKEKYLVTGTPCQIDSFRRYIRRLKCEDNFVLMDFFCHGAPSKLMWDKYLAEVEKKTGKVVYVSWRNKFTGWHDSWSMAIDEEEHGNPINWHDSYNMLIRAKKTFYNSRLSQGDLFYRMFLSNTCLGKACYDKCKYKHLSSSADIRIGDLWGKAYSKDDKGVNGVIAFTNKGNDILCEINSLSLQDCDIEVVTEGQMKKKTERPMFYSIVSQLLKSDCGIKIFRPILFAQRVTNYMRRLFK